MANENKRDYYEVLGRPQGCDRRRHQEAPTASLPRKYHPDVNHEPGAEERFKEINEANEVLSDRG